MNLYDWQCGLMPTKRQRKEATCVYSTKEGAHLKIGNAAENAIVAK